MEYLIYAISVAILAYGRYADIKSSKDFLYYGLTEGFAFSRDADGMFDLKKNLIGSAVFLAATTIAAFFVPLPAALANTIFGVVSFVIAKFHNEKKKANARERQIKILEEFREGGQPYLGPLVTRNGKSFYGLFRWIFVTNLDLNDAQAVMAAESILYLRIGDLAHQDNPFPA